MFIPSIEVNCTFNTLLMKHFLRYLVISFLILPVAANAQFETLKDSVVQLYGIVMTHDSLKGIPDVSVIVKGQGRGTITNIQGVFSIVVLKGDTVEFSHVSYRKENAIIPKNIPGNQYNMSKLMSIDTVYLPTAIIKPRPTREEFERDFVNAKVDADDIEIARENTSEAKRRVLARSMPRDAGEATNYTLAQNSKAYYYKGQVPPMNIFNPFAWL